MIPEKDGTDLVTEQQALALPWPSALGIAMSILEKREEDLLRQAFTGSSRRCKLCKQHASRKKLTAHGGHSGHCPMVRLNTVIRATRELLRDLRNGR